MTQGFRIRGSQLVVQKLGYDGSKSYRWVGRQLSRDERELLFYAVFDRDGRDLGYVQFERGDVFYEYYFFDRWYNVFQIYSREGSLKGWYCNVSKPPVVEAGELTFVDLALDLFVYPDGSYLVLDEDEFEELAQDQYSDEDVALARAALDELIQLAQTSTLPGRPFDG
ncbi:MAG: DUF402 domain-containing protein [Chloroflexota bacterium]